MSSDTNVDLAGRTVAVTRSLARIDRDNLVEEVCEGNAAAVHWGILYAHAAADASRRKTRVEVVKAEAAKRIRSRKVKGDKTFTVDVIKDEVALDPEVQAAVEEHIQAEERAAILKAAHDGAAGKARTLEKMASLIGQELNASRPPLLPPDRRPPLLKRPVT